MPLTQARSGRAATLRHVSSGLYRSPAAFSAKTLEQLFRAGDLVSESARLRVVHTLTPWKRHTVTLHHRPSSLAEYLVALAKRAPVRIDVQRAEKLDAERYVLRSEGGRVVLGARGDPEDVALLDTIEAARVRTGGASFAIAERECRFAVSGYDAARLPAKFAQHYVLAELELPELIEQTWVVIGHGA